MKLKSLLLTLGATLAVGLGALAGVTSMDKGAKEVKADNDVYSISASFNNWNEADTTYTLTDEDGDGVYTINITLSAGDEFYIVKNHSNKNGKYARGCMASYPTGKFWGTGQYEGDSNMHAVEAGNYRFELKPDIGRLEIYTQDMSITMKTFYLLQPSSWSDWTGARLHWWGDNSGMVSNYYAAEKLESTGKTGSYGTVSGSILKAYIPFDVTKVQVVKADFSAQTSEFTLSGTDDAKAFLKYTDEYGNHMVGFSVYDGGYIQGKYHGVVNWSSNIELSDDIVDEYVTYDYDSNEFHACLELYAGDYFKFVQYYEGKAYWRTISSKSSSNNISYPVGWYDGNNVGVENAGVYYITAGRDNDNEWYYFDATAEQFAYAFLNSMTCDSTGSAEPEWKETPEGDSEEYYSWSYFSTWYYKLDKYAKNKFYSANPVAESGDHIEDAVQRYLYLVANHNYEPFITNESGTVRGASHYTHSILNLETLGSNNTLIIIAIAGVSLLAVAGFFLLKRKEER